jgi:hypothetical protein
VGFTQALKSVKDPSKTFDLNLKRTSTLPSLIYFQISKLIFDILLWGHYKYPILFLIPDGIVLAHLGCMSHGIFIESSLHNLFSSNIKVDIRHPAVGLRCRNPPRHLSLKCLGWFLHLKPTAECQISTLIFEKK